MEKRFRLNSSDTLLASSAEVVVVVVDSEGGDDRQWQEGSLISDGKQKRHVGSQSRRLASAVASSLTHSFISFPCLPVILIQLCRL